MEWIESLASQTKTGWQDLVEVLHNFEPNFRGEDGQLGEGWRGRRDRRGGCGCCWMTRSVLYLRGQADNCGVCGLLSMFHPL